MAAAVIPPALKAADIARFAQRAGQLEKARPAVAYWCNYWIVDQIIAKGLHQADDDSKRYTTRLMENLEQAKQDFAEDDAVMDDMAGHAYIEQFGQETFQRAENAMKASRASRQTADTFQAAATFLELCQIWGPLDSNIASKIKFAKYHALRIAKAIKAGEDPNMTNPAPEPSPKFQQPPLDKNDLDVQIPDGLPPPNRQPSVEEISDNQLSNDPSPQEESYYHNASVPEPAPSPLAPLSTDRKMSDGGGYFPTVPGGATDSTDRSMTLPGPSAILPSPRLIPNSAPSLNSLHSTSLPRVDQSKIPSTASPAPSFPTQRATVPKVARQPASQPMPPSVSPLTHQKAPLPAFNVLKTDEASVLAAQKHAKFAISALNFEDVKTAVKELREALETLGAS